MNVRKLLAAQYADLERVLPSLEPRHRETIRRYYAALLDAPQVLRSWLLEAEARRLEPALAVVDQGSAVLDAGCGLGFHACLFRRAGAQVIGVDLSSDRVDAGRELARHLVPDPPELLSRSVHRLLSDDRRQWKVVWVNEAISHIEPVPEFLQGVATRLEAGGRIVISDHNAANPLIRSEARRERGREVMTTTPDPETGEPVPYARERMFTARQLGDMLSVAGLRVIDVIPHGFIPPALRRPRWAHGLQRLEKLMRRLPGAQLLSGSYTVVAVPEAARPRSPLDHNSL